MRIYYPCCSLSLDNSNCNFKIPLCYKGKFSIMLFKVNRFQSFNAAKGGQDFYRDIKVAGMP